MASNELTLLSRKNLLHIVSVIGNVSLACKLSNCSRTHYYYIKKLFETNGELGLQPRTRKKPNLKNRVGLEIEKAVLKFSLEHPTFGKSKINLLLRQQNVLISSSTIRNIWIRHNIETIQKRLKVAKTIFIQTNA